MSGNRKFIISITPILLVVFCALGCSTRVSTLGQDLEDDGFSVGKTQYFVSPLAKEDWYDENVLDYSQGYFSFPPPAGRI